MESLLTITIPTFNRCDCLDLLLESIAKQLAPVAKDVSVIVMDNHSSDQTPACCEKWGRQIERLVYIRNSENIGMSRNIIKCFEITQSMYSWSIGDDDILRLGIIQHIVDLLKQQQPDLVHMNVEPFLGSPSPDSVTFIGPVTPRSMDNVSFTRIVHIYTTFISGMIINKRAFHERSPLASLHEHENTVIPQLAWILDILKHGQRFVYVPQRLILGRREGSGGYNLYKTFSLDLVNILDRQLPEKLGRLFKRRMILKYLPSLIIKTRKKKIGAFTVTRDEEFLLKRAYSGYASYWLLIVPLLRLPLPLASFVFYASRLISKFVSVYDRIWAYRLFHLGQ
jgi:glycosyltransferase involved in cell wall biosynthesis